MKASFFTLILLLFSVVTMCAQSPAHKAFPKHWGSPPKIQTRDFRELPGGYGQGSSTLARWIQDHLDQDAAKGGTEKKQATISGELRQWHKVTLTLDGPHARETDTDLNPFLDHALDITFTHADGTAYLVPGHFAADGNAAETGATEGRVWRAHFSPDKTGLWTYRVAFLQGARAAISGQGAELRPWHGMTGTFEIVASDKAGRDLRAHGRLRYVGRHHLQFAGSQRWFLKAGADAPETLLAYADFDGTETHKPEKGPLKTWQQHTRDWREGDPQWRGGKGRGLIGALNYLASTGCNAFSFLTYNAAGDGDNVWPFTSRDDKLHYDCSKLDQWGIVFDHATTLGLYCHFKLQETENDDHRLGHNRKPANVPAALDGGALGVERKLYLRELVSRFGHLLALNWNLGEENTQTPEEQRAMARWIAEVDPWQHLRVIHTYPNEQDQVYTPLLRDQSMLTGASLQNSWNQVHQRTLQWLRASAKAGVPWVVANDEQGGADTGVPPDIGYQGYAGKTRDGKSVQSPDDIRKHTLWGNLMAGGAGVEYYFGYKLPENDLVCEDWRSRDQSWRWAGLALKFFEQENIPFWEMTSANALIGNAADKNDRYCLAKPGELYLVYLPQGGATELDLGAATGSYTLAWFDPRQGGPLTNPSTVQAGQKAPLTAPDAQDWLALLRRVR